MSVDDPAGQAPGWIELVNPSGAAAELAGLSLTDDSAFPTKYIFPPNVAIGSAGYLRLSCDARAPASATNTGFGLSWSGGRLLLYQSIAGASHQTADFVTGFALGTDATGRAWIHGADR